ncbi:MAG: type II secretion system F family protein [Myxococcota bacterium]
MQIILAALIFASVASAVLAVASLSGRRPVKRRLARLADGTSAEVPKQSAADGVLSDDRKGLLERLLAPLAGKAANQADAPAFEPVRRRLVQAGYRRESAVPVFMGSRIALALLLPGLIALSPLAWSFTELQLAVLLCTAAGLGVVIPGYWVDKRRKSRQEMMILGLPDALDLMVVCVEAGLGINACLARVADEFTRTNPILSAEFELVTLEIRAGKSSTEALRALSERTGVSEVSSLVAMLVQTERFGTSLADTLRVQADALRVQRLQRAEELAAIAPLKMLVPTVIIFVATLMVTIGPGMLQLFQFFEDR